MRWRRTARRTAGGDSQVRIEPARAGDVAALDVLYASVGWTGVGAIRARDQFLLARRGTLVDGALMYWLESPDLLTQSDSVRAPYADSSRLWVSELAVAPHAQRAGLGRALMHAAARTAIEHELDWMRTWPSTRGSEIEQNGRVAFFTACGMTPWQPDGSPLEMLAHAASVLAATETG
jgi:GNAT superfamily N-acetyltransferase